MVTKLTDKQKAALARYRDEWTAIGLATERPGFYRGPAESAVRKAYECAGLTPPSTFIWTKSPLHTGVVYTLFNTPPSLRQSVCQSVRQSVCESVWQSVDQSVRQSVLDFVKQSVWESVRDFVKQSVWESVWKSCYGSHDAGWLAHYRFFNDECKIDCSELEGLWECARHCGWFIPLTDTAIISPRPYALRTRINARGHHELHADGEPAVYYCDDFQIYAHKGVRLPAKYGSVRSSEWLPEWTLTEENQEVKRVLLEAIPSEKLETVLGLQVLDTYQSPRSRYELFEAKNNPYPSPYKALRFTCPTTGRQYMERVHPSATSARAAVTESNWGVDPEQFGWEC